MMSALRHLARPGRRKLREVRARVLRRLGLLPGDWGAGLNDETDFWEKVLADGGRAWVPGEFDRRMDPARPLQPELQELVDALSGSVVRVLDVGAGPLTTLGKRWEGRALEIVAIDPLADKYDALLSRLGISPPVRTVPGHGETLREQFRENEFDLAYASNSLDHSYDPMRAILQMLAVAKPGCHVYLWHFANEGLHESYRGLHQWNFDVRDGDFLVGDGRSERSLQAAVQGRATLRCERLVDYGKPVVVARLKKLALHPPAPSNRTAAAPPP